MKVSYADKQAQTSRCINITEYRSHAEEYLIKVAEKKKMLRGLKK